MMEWPVHFLISTSQVSKGRPLFFCPSTSPCITVCTNIPSRRVTWPNHCNFRLLTTSSRGSYSPMRPLILCTTVSLLIFCFQVIPRSLRKQRISYTITLCSILLLRVQVRNGTYSAIEVTSDLINFTLVGVEILLVFHSLFSFASFPVAVANLFLTSVSDVTSSVMVLPRYWKDLTSSRVHPSICICLVSPLASLLFAVTMILLFAPLFSIPYFLAVESSLLVRSANSL